MSKQKRTNGTKADETPVDGAVVAELETLRLPELQARYRDVVGETTKSPNRKFLIGRIAEALAARPVDPEVAEDENVISAPAEAAEVVPAAEPTAEVGCTSDTPAAEPAPENEVAAAEETPAAGSAPEYEVVATQAEPQESSTLAEVVPGAEATEDHVGSPATPPVEAPREETTAETCTPAEPPEAKQPRGRFARMSIAELQTLYLEKVGRSTGSEHRGYLIWKIREAEKGRIKVGPVQARTRTAGEPRDLKVLPLSLETTTVEKMDAAWRAKGIKSRAEFLRKAIGTCLTQLGATEEAALFAAE